MEDPREFSCVESDVMTITLKGCRDERMFGAAKTSGGKTAARPK